MRLPACLLQKGTCFSTDTWTVYCPEHAELCDSSGSQDADMREKRQALRSLRREQQQLRQQAGAGAAAAVEAAAGAARRSPAARKAMTVASRQKADDSRQQPPPAKRRRASEVSPTGAAPAADPSSKQRLAVEPRPNGSAAAAAAASAAAGLPPAANGKQGSTGQGAAQTEDEPGASGVAELAVAEERVRQEKQHLQELQRQVQEQERHLVPPPQEQLQAEPQQQQQEQPQLSGAVHGMDDTTAAGQQQLEEEQGQLQQEEEEGLPADVKGLVQEVYGKVAPDRVPQAQAYLWKEGVRSFRWVLYAYALPKTSSRANFCLHALRAHAMPYQNPPSI
jgi:hypothetical protein